MRRTPQTIRLSPKAYPLDWTRLALTVIAGVLLVVAIYAKFSA